MHPSEITGPDKENREKAARIEEKKARGETLTREEAGFLGAMGAMKKGAQRERQAAREGHHDDYQEAHRTESWMAGDDTRDPHLSKDTRREVEEIREKQARGDTLTRHEAGVLGGAARAKDAEST